MISPQFSRLRDEGLPAITLARATVSRLRRTVQIRAHQALQDGQFSGKEVAGVRNNDDRQALRTRPVEHGFERYALVLSP